MTFFPKKEKSTLIEVGTLAPYNLQSHPSCRLATIYDKIHNLRKFGKYVNFLT